MGESVAVEDSASLSCGQGAKWDDFEQMLKAAEQGDAVAQSTLAWCYDTGNGVGIDPAEAVKWYGKAAEQGYEAAKAALKELNFFR